MAVRDPLVIVDGCIQELPSGDTVTGASGGGTHTSGTLAARPAPVAGDTYLISSDAGKGDAYISMVDNKWQILPYHRNSSPDELDALRWKMLETADPYVSTGISAYDLTKNGGGSRTAASYSGQRCTRWSNGTTSGSNADIGISTTPTQITMSAWINSTTVDGTDRFVLKCAYNYSDNYDDKNTGFTFSSSGFKVYLVRGGSMATYDGFNIAPAQNTWHHVGFTYDGPSEYSMTKVWLDGEEVSSPGRETSGYNSGSNPLSLGSASRWVIGGHYGNTSAAMLGRIADARVYVGVRTAAWWQEIYSRGIGAYTGA